MLYFLIYLIMMQQQNSESGQNDLSRAKESFTTTDFIDKIKETICLAREIIQHPSAKKSDKIQDLIKIQCCNALTLLNRLNQTDPNRNNHEADFTRIKFDDQQKMAKLIELDDAIIDKTIHYFECLQNIRDKPKSNNPNLIQVQLTKNQNDSKIVIKDYKKNSNNLQQLAGFKRKSLFGQNNGEPSSKVRNIMFIAASNVKRPQIVYKIKVDNAYSTPFIPKLTRKPNSIISLEESLKPVPNETQMFNTQNTNDKNAINYPTHSYPHPYQKEIEAFSPDQSFFEPVPESELKKPIPFNEKPYIFISKRNELQDLIEVLKNYKEIAVDLEHHSFRTYQGLTCLIQLSTDDHDYIIDVFPLWNDLELLNEIFTSPKILKVFHSSNFDIIWLQRDLGIYVVNMFDTWVAGKILEYQNLSLSALAYRFCDGFQMDKRFQLVDWRIRPLPEEMMNYARCDTHFLLYIYRQMKQELLKRNPMGNLLQMVMERSQQICLKRYEKRLPEANDHVHLVWKNNMKFDQRQLTALKSLWVWRDVIARHEDESIGYVLPNNLLLKICEILPREQQGILACCNPIPPLVRQYINDIHKIILDARSKVSVDQQSMEKNCSLYQKNDMIIDLTHDLLMDKTVLKSSSSSTSSSINHDHHHGHRHHQDDDDDDIHENPLLRWSTEASKFIRNIQTHPSSKTTPMDLDDNGKNDDLGRKQLHNQNKNHHQLSMIDMLGNNHQKLSLSKPTSSSNENNSNARRPTMEELFDGYTTFYQKYLSKIKQKEMAKK